MQARFDRRRFLVASSTLSAAAISWRAGTPARGADTVAIRLQPSNHGLFRVRMQMTLEGNVDIPKNPLVSKERDRQLPIQATSVIDFEERWMRDAENLPAAARRYYYEAQSRSTIGARTSQSELRESVRRISARLVDGPVVIYGDEEFLNHDELDLLQLPACSLAVDAVLPTKEVRVGDTWVIEGPRLARLLNLDAVQKSTLTGELVAIAGDHVRLQMQGRVDGSVEGVPTAIDVAGKVTFDRPNGVITWLAMAVREIREIGKAKPGFQISATIKMIRKPLETANAVKDTTPIDLSEPTPAKSLLVQIDSQHGMFTTFLDRRWRVVSDAPGLATIRMISNDVAIAQCDIREMPKMKPGEQLTLEAFQSDIQRSLDSRFGQFIEAEEGVNGGGLRTLRVAVMGSVQSVPVQWVFLHFSDDLGRRVGATFTLESDQVEIFGGSDAQLANSFHFKPAAAAQQAAAETTTVR